MLQFLSVYSDAGVRNYLTVTVHDFLPQQTIVKRCNTFSSCYDSATGESLKQKLWRIITFQDFRLTTSSFNFVAVTEILYVPTSLFSMQVFF